MSSFKDQLNRKVDIPKNPERIISLVPSQTELLVDLGLTDEVVGVTKFCVHPENLRKEKTVVGGTKKVHYDKIRMLKPDLILCNKEENTEEMVLELEQIAPVHVSDVKTVEDALQLIEQYGKIFKKEEKALEISEEIRHQKSIFEAFVTGKPEKKVAYLIWRKPYMVAGKDTFINHLLQLNRLKNVFLEEDSRYPEISLKQLEEKEVDLVLLSTEPFPFKEKHVRELQKEVRGVSICIVDGEYFSWYGSRLIAAFAYFREIQSKF